MNEKILVVDDEKKITDVVRAYLEKEGYIALVADSGQKALELIDRSKPDLIILDLRLPDMAGEQICQRLRQRSDVPIIMLTAKVSEEERVKGLMIGADDYLVKPFSPRELVARVRAILRRVRRDTEALRDRLSFNNGAITIDLVRHEVKKNGQLVSLTALEYKLLVALAQHPGRVYSRLQLVNKVQGYDFEGYERTIDAHIKNLRHKIEPDPKNPHYIQTVYGIGYKFTGEEDV